MVVTNDKGVASDAIDIRKGGADNKWKVTKTGIYTFAVDLRTRKLSVTYEGEELAGPTPWDTETVYMIGSATPAADTEVNDQGVANDALVYGTEKSYGDKKWKVTKAGKYKLTLDLKSKNPWYRQHHSKQPCL